MAAEPGDREWSGASLRDASRMKLVKLKSAGLFLGESLFEMLVSCDPRFTDLVIVLSGQAIRAKTDKDKAVVVDVLGAVLGG